MKVIITCGPSFEPIDEVRRITNFSTGELGILLTNRLARDGCEVVCFKGVGATCPAAVECATVVSFSTNEDLRQRLADLPARDEVAAVFHAAALCDFKIAKALDTDGNELVSAKIPSSLRQMQLILEPAVKLIFGLRALFPNSRIVGWKYELAGTRDDAITKAVKQIRDNKTDACVVNGTAYGAGFGYCDATGLLRHVEDKVQLCDFLAAGLASKRRGP
jgi:phosphopantothenate---cysteine ligase (CTP)